MKRPSLFVPALKTPLAVLLTYALSWTPACNNDFDQPSEIKTLRVIAVVADKSIASPGEEVNLVLTGQDGGDNAPHEIEVAWLGVCANPPGGEASSCFPRLAAALANPAAITREVLLPSEDGAFTSLAFSLQMPDDILTPAFGAGAGAAERGSLLVFFSVCAGQVGPLELPADATEFDLPLACFDDAGNRLGSEHAVIGHTQLTAYPDGRTNAIPPIEGVALNGVLLGDTAADNVVVSCTGDEGEAGCGRGQQADGEGPCTSYEIAALIGDVAEVDPETFSFEGESLRETVWVDYYVDEGTVSGSRQLVSDDERGYQSDFTTSWTPPSIAGPVRIWAVVHDSRGGIAVTSGLVLVE